MKTNSSAFERETEPVQAPTSVKDALLAYLRGEFSPIRQFILDALQLDLSLEREAWHRWGNLAFMAGVCLQDSSRDKAANFCAHASIDCAASRKLLPRLRALAMQEFDMRHPVIRGKRIFQQLLEGCSAFRQFEAGPKAYVRQFLEWIRLCVGLGIEALAGDNLFAAECCVGARTFSMSQRFLFSHFTHSLTENPNPDERHIFVRMVQESYRPQSAEAKVLSAVALALLQRFGIEHADVCEEWIVEAFRIGVQTAKKNNRIGDSLMTETDEKTLNNCRSLLAYFPDRPFSTWSEKEIVAAARAWCAEVHPQHLRSRNRVEFYDGLRDLVDFAFWMGFITRRCRTNAAAANN